MVGCNCRICRSPNPKDKRLRTSALVCAEDVNILIDTSMDYRQQMLNAGVSHLDGVIYTHHHVDHVLGLDDLRSLNILHKASIPLYGLQETMDNIKRIFTYAFESEDNLSSVPRLSINIIDEEPFEIKGVKILPVPLFHGEMPILGFRIGDFAYCTDVSKIPEASYEKLRGVKILILDALRYKSHPTHLSISEAVEESRKLKAGETYLTHISHRVLHDEAEARLPERVHLAYDGLKLVI